MAQPRLKRPISPHLQAYNMIRITSALSVANRMTGGAIGFGLLFFILWLGAAAYGPDVYASVMVFLTSWFAWLVYFGVSVALIFHFFNGIRFMVWDTGLGFQMPQVIASGIAVLALTALTTAAFWACVLVRLAF